MFAIFNSKKEFWHVGSRSFEKDPYWINTITEIKMEWEMAKKSDPTSDFIAFEDSQVSKASALEFINNLKYPRE